MAMAGRLRSSFPLLRKILTVDSLSSSPAQRSTSSLQRSLLCPSLTNPEFSWNYTAASAPKEQKVKLGNSVLEYATDLNSSAEYFWSHGLISDSMYKMFTSSYNHSRYVSEYYRDALSPVCSSFMSQINRETSRFVDKFEVTLDVYFISLLPVQDN